MAQNFARSMSVQDAMSAGNMLAYEMNGEPLPKENGYPYASSRPDGTASPT